MTGDDSARRRIRLAVVMGTSVGGVGTHVRSVIDRLPREEFQVTVVGPPETDEHFGFTSSGMRFVPVPVATIPRPDRDLAAVRGIRRALAGADVVHAHGFRAAALTGLALGRRRTGRVPFLATWHNAVLGGGMRRRVLSRLERLAARRADLTLGASRDLVARAIALGAPDARSGPVAAPALAPPARSAADVRAELDAIDRWLVLAVGRLAPQKDYGTLLSAVGLLVARARDGGSDTSGLRGEGDAAAQRLLVLIAGNGPEHDALRATIDRHQLPVRLLGHRDDVADLLQAADAYVLSSQWEARALVVQEAMRAGTPVVATAVGGIPELTGDGADALLVPPADPEALADALGRLLADDALRTDLARRGRERSTTWPDEDATAADLARLYRVLAGSG